jgi:hypothetical protein
MFNPPRHRKRLQPEEYFFRALCESTITRIGLREGDSEKKSRWKRLAIHRPLDNRFATAGSSPDLAKLATKNPRQRRRFQHLAGLLLGQLLCDEFAQLVVDQRQQLLGGVWAAGFVVDENALNSLIRHRRASFPAMAECFLSALSTSASTPALEMTS